MSKAGKLRLGAFMYPAGHHVAAWRHPDTAADATTSFRQRIAFAQAAERAKFDLIFLADGSRPIRLISNLSPGLTNGPSASSL